MGSLNGTLLHIPQCFSQNSFLKEFLLLNLFKLIFQNFEKNLKKMYLYLQNMKKHSVHEKLSDVAQLPSRSTVISFRLARLVCSFVGNKSKLAHLIPKLAWLSLKSVHLTIFGLNFAHFGLKFGPFFS